MIDEEYRQALVDLILWYRDFYHKKDFGHTEMINKLNLIQDEKDLAIYEQVVDGWLD